MNILQINTVYKTGSTGRIAQELNNIILNNGWQSYIAYGRGVHNEDNVIRIGNDIDMYMHALGTRIFDKHGLYSEKVTVDFIKRIEKLNIDIFHLHNIHGYYLHFPTLFQYLKDKKVIWTLHDCWPFTGHCAYYDFVQCNKWQDECCTCPQKKSYPSSFLFDNSRENFKLKKEYFSSLSNLTIITPSRWLENEVKKSFLAKYPMKTIHNGIDADIFKPTKSSFKNIYNIQNQFVILGVANVWDERKGLQYFLDISKNLESDEIIVLVGLNEKQQRSLPKSILGFKRTDSVEELVDIYSMADVFVNPTLEDNFPTTNLESLACGTPVITFDTGGSVESIDKNTGYIVPKEDIFGLYKAIKKVKSKGKKSFSTSCREKALLMFDKNKNFEQYIKLYEAL